MSFEITCNNKNLWENNDGLIFNLYLSLTDILLEENIQINQRVKLLINSFEIVLGDVGFDIADYLESKEDLFMFAGFIKQAIEIMEKDLSLTAQQREYLWSFHSKIINCAGDFKD